MYPGKTRQINFYNIDNTFYFVDLPGYGYSKMSKEEQLKSGKFIEEYLSKRSNISLIILLLDIRHKPTTDDRLMYHFLVQNNLQFIIVANKADKLAPTKVDLTAQDIKKELDTDVPVLPFSSEKRIYMQDVIDEMFKE